MFSACSIEALLPMAHMDSLTLTYQYCQNSGGTRVSWEVAPSLTMQDMVACLPHGLVDRQQKECVVLEKISETHFPTLKTMQYSTLILETAWGL